MVAESRDTDISRHIFRERRMGREDAMNTGERDQALYLDDDFEKQIKIEDLEVHLWEELFEDHALEDLLRQGGEGTIVSFLRGGDTVNAGPDAEFDSIMNGNRGPDAPPRERGEPDALKSGRFTRKRDREEDATQDEGLARQLRTVIRKRRIAVRMIEAVVRNLTPKK